MRFFPFYIFCLVVGQLGLFSTSSLAQTPVSFFDAHYHFPDDAKLEFTNRLRKEGEFFKRTGALLLSDYTEDDSEELFVLQKTVSDAIAQDQSDMKLYGLCGANLRHPQLLDQVKRCLALPHMVGVKLHLHGVATRLSSKGCRGNCHGHFRSGYKKELAEVAKLVAQHNGVILIHFVHFTEFLPPSQHGYYVNGTQWKEERYETEALAEIANQYPRVRFIVAHGGVGSSSNPKSLTWLATQLKHKNVYLEVSAIIGHGFGFGLCANVEDRPHFVFADEQWPPLADPKECLPKLQTALKSPDTLAIVESWKALGLDRILFGTDGPAPSVELESLQYFLNLPGLTAQQKAMILRHNAKSLFP